VYSAAAPLFHGSRLGRFIIYPERLVLLYLQGHRRDLETVGRSDQYGLQDGCVLCMLFCAISHGTVPRRVNNKMLILYITAGGSSPIRIYVVKSYGTS